MDDDSKMLIQLLNNLKHKLPLIILGEYSVLFRKLYKDKIYKIEDLDDSIHSNYVVIDIDDLKDFKLLTDYLDNSNYGLILLRYKDDLPYELLLKFNFIIKRVNSVDNELLNIQQALDKLKLLDENIDMNSFYAKFSPELKYNKRKISKLSSQSKIISLLGGI